LKFCRRLQKILRLNKKPAEAGWVNFQRILKLL
jgi:hypothetical protein